MMIEVHGAFGDERARIDRDYHRYGQVWPDISIDDFGPALTWLQLRNGDDFRRSTLYEITDGHILIPGVARGADCRPHRLQGWDAEARVSQPGALDEP